MHFALHMSTTRSVTRAKATQATGGTAKKAVSGAVASTGLTDSTNIHTSAPQAKKTNVSASTSTSRASLLPSASLGPVTPRGAPSSATSRVPASAKSQESVLKTQPPTTKPTDTWLPLPTPVPISSSRSFSELMKSEELLSSKVAQLQALCEKQQRMLAEKDIEIKTLKNDVAIGQDQITKVHRSWEAKIEAVLSQQQEKYQDLNDRYLAVLTRARSCETKLEEMFVDPLTLKPFERTDQNRDSTAQQQRTLMSLIEEHQQRENLANLEYQKATERMLKQAVEELCGNAQTSDELISSARYALSEHNLGAELRQLELSIPNLIESSTAQANLAYDDAESDLDWSVMTTDEDSVASPLRPTSTLPTHGKMVLPRFGEFGDDCDEMQDDEDHFFNDSYIEDDFEPLEHPAAVDL